MASADVEAHGDSGGLKPCSICKRTFNPLSIERHEKVCEKNQKSKQRKVFDSFSQRTKGIGTSVKPIKKEQNKKPNVKWKEQHEALLRTIRNSKRVSSTENMLNNGSSNSKSIPPGYVQCPACYRCFNHRAADRHISWCQEKLSRVPKSPPSFEALQRLKARVQYRAPLPGKKQNLHCETQRLIRSAESCKSPSIQRTHSSPGPLNREPSARQVTFLQQPPQIIPRRRSCERTSNAKEINVLRRHCNPISLKKPTNDDMREKNTVKFKEKFPNYHSTRKSVPLSHRDFENLLYDEYFTDNKGNENSDILSALRLQLAELEVTERVHRNKNTGRNTTDFVCLPAVSSSEITSSLGVCNVLSCEGNDYRHSGSSGSDGSLPSLGSQRSSEPRMPRFCYQCGTKYPITSAKYCCECGARRLILSNENTGSVHS